MEENIHQVRIGARESIEISGVENVLSFDEYSATLQTTCGLLTIDGEKLHISTMATESGTISLDGRIYGVYYTESSQSGKQKKSRFR